NDYQLLEDLVKLYGDRDPEGFNDWFGEALEIACAHGYHDADLPQNSLKARSPRNFLIINEEVISHNHFPQTRPEKRFSPLISRHRTRVTGLQ
ncbi:hypothetical protein, partial [Dichelobacter nodosus]